MYNPDELNELPLSDYEKGYLTAVYECLAQVEATEYLEEYPEENFWYQVVVDDRTFDLGIWLSNENNSASDKVCEVYECREIIDDMGIPSGEYSTDTSLGYYLKEAT